ncbi:MAG: alpha/beta hydrolase [Bacteroidales bacterium]|nr:alpha/beta hydrolase [Bacteroidales bacterium]
MTKRFVCILLSCLFTVCCFGRPYKTRTVRIETPGGKMKMKVLEPKEGSGSAPGILWIHGGGYTLGGTYMLGMTCAPMLAERLGAVVVFPDYRLAWQSPYPAALEDCYAALEWMFSHADELGIDRSRIILGGESAGGGLVAATCLYARDKGEIPIAVQLPLYPMLDCEDTESSADNHGRVWNTRRNHWGWKHYLSDAYGTDSVSKYASPARETDYSRLPPCYTFVCDGEPFYAETLQYVKNLQDAGVEASVDVYPGNVHAFDMLQPGKDKSRNAREKLYEELKRLLKR